MEVINFIETHWELISFIVGEMGFLIVFAIMMIQAIKCLLRNDILGIYDRCKPTKQITRYQLQSAHLSYTIYKKLGGNSFIDEIMEEIKDFEIIN